VRPRRTVCATVGAMQRSLLTFVVALVVALTFGCDRRTEPYVPGEEPKAPDLSRIFPRGAEQAKEREDAAGGAETAQGGRGTTPAAMGAPAGAPPAAPDAAGQAETSGPPIRGTVTLAPELAGRVPKDAVLFLIARRGDSGPPTAVKRIPSPTFPFSFELGPGDRMIQAMPWSGPLGLSARVDSDGNATTRSAGDLQGKGAGPVNPGDEGVTVVLDEVL